MTTPTPQPSSRTPPPLAYRQSPPRSPKFGIPAAAALAIFLLALPWLLPLDGKPHGALQQFLGRFHPLAIHLPIALLLLLPLLEIAGRTRPALRDAAAFILPCAALCTVGSVLLGILLAHGAGFAPDAVRGHMWSGILLAFTVLVCTLIRPAWQAGYNPRLYPASLTAAVLLTFWTGHQGGAITYGSGYLTQFAPSHLPHPAPRKAYPPVDPASAYATRIQPILNTNCVSCHGPAKRKGGLQLDTYAHLMDGGTSGQVIAEGDPDRSILYTRITLPRTDRKFMPSEGKPPLSAADTALIRAWIADGASPLATSHPPSLPASPTQKGGVPSPDLSHSTQDPKP